jgi:hypothetical protein
VAGDDRRRAQDLDGVERHDPLLLVESRDATKIL